MMVRGRCSAPHPDRAVNATVAGRPGNWVFADLVQIRGDSFGSGLLVAPGLVLTALHCVADPDRGWAPRGTIEVYLLRELDGDPPLERGWPARIVWRAPPVAGRAPPDLALLGLDGPEDGRPLPRPTRPGRLRWGEAGIMPVPASALGFPKVTTGPVLPGGREEGAFPGSVNLFSKSRDALLFASTLIPAQADWQQWRGLSGGPLFCGDTLVGVMRGVESRFLQDRTLEAEPLSLNDPQHGDLARRLDAIEQGEAAAAEAAAIAAAARQAALAEEMKDLFGYVYLIDRDRETRDANLAIGSHVGRRPVELLISGHPADLCDEFFLRLWRDHLPPRRKEESGAEPPTTIPWPNRSGGTAAAARDLAYEAMSRLGLESWSYDLATLGAMLAGQERPGWIALRLPEAPQPEDLALLAEWRAVWASLAVPAGQPLGYALLFTARPDPPAALLLDDGALQLGQARVRLRPVTIGEVRAWHEELRRRCDRPGMASPLPSKAFRFAEYLAEQGRAELTLREIRALVAGTRSAAAAAEWEQTA